MTTTIKTKAIIFYLEPQDHKAIKKLAFKHELTMSELLRNLAQEALRQDEYNKLDLQNKSK